MREVESEVDDATAGRSQVSFVKEDAHEEALHDSSHSERQEEKEEDDGIAVIEHLSSLRTKKTQQNDVGDCSYCRCYE